MKPEDLIKFALNRVNKGLSYGPDMATSRAMCLNDASAIIEMALADEQVEQARIEQFAAEFVKEAA